MLKFLMSLVVRFTDHQRAIRESGLFVFFWASAMTSGSAQAQVQGPELLEQNPFLWTKTDSPSNWRLLNNPYFASRWNDGVFQSGSLRYPLSLLPGKRYRLNGRGASGDPTAYGPASARIGVGVEGGTGLLLFPMNNTDTSRSMEFIAGPPPHTAVVSYVFDYVTGGLSGLPRVQSVSLAQLFNAPAMDIAETSFSQNSDCPGVSDATVTLHLNSLSTPDDPTQWSIDWGDGAVLSQPTLNAGSIHVYELRPGEDSRTWTATFSGSNLAGSASDSVSITINRQGPSSPLSDPLTSQLADAGQTVVFAAVLNPNAAGGPFQFQWRKGAAILTDGGRFTGTQTPTLTIFNTVESDLGTFEITITDMCGTETRSSATLGFYCPVDFNHSGSIGVQDIFDFLAAYFAGEFRADFNRSSSVTVQDIFDFLAAYFAGCA